MKLKDHIGSISGLIIYHPERKQNVKIMSAYNYHDHGIGFWFEVPDGKDKEMSIWTFENKEDALNLEIIERS